MSGGALLRRPRAVIFDVNETLIDLAPLADSFDALGLPEFAMQWWFATLLRDGFAMAALDDVAAFHSLARVALNEVTAIVGQPIDDIGFAAFLDAFRALPLHRDVAPALRSLKDAGTPVVALTNGNAAVANEWFTQSGIADLVDEVYSVETVHRWKPRHEPYDYVLARLGFEPANVAMVATHPWDLEGAARCQLITAWINRSSRPYPDVFARPSVQAQNLERLVEVMLASPEHSV